MTQSELSILQSIARGVRFIEVGACVGGSTIPLAKVAGHVVSIDKHYGYGPDTLNLYMRNTSHLIAKITPVIGDFNLILANQVGDAALIDLLGTYDTTFSALDRMPSTVKLVAIHDVGRPNCEGVIKAIKDSAWVPMAQADTLVILGRK